jgi:hypothetical protein
MDQKIHDTPMTEGERDKAKAQDRTAHDFYGAWPWSHCFPAASHGQFAGRLIAARYGNVESPCLGASSTFSLGLP